MGGWVIDWDRGGEGAAGLVVTQRGGERLGYGRGENRGKGWGSGVGRG